VDCLGHIKCVKFNTNFFTVYIYIVHIYIYIYHICNYLIARRINFFELKNAITEITSQLNFDAQYK